MYLAYSRILCRDDFPATGALQIAFEAIRNFTIYHLGVDVAWANKHVYSRDFPAEKYKIPKHPTLQFSKEQNFEAPTGTGPFAPQ